MLELPSEQKTWSESTICVIIFLGREEQKYWENGEKLRLLGKKIHLSITKNTLNKLTFFEFLSHLCFQIIECSV